ncbi:MAG: iron-containing alcohol dehydrogenase [Xanthobacteraceae bacterium]
MKDDMLSGTHRNSLQEQVIYGRPALEALTDLGKAFGAHRLMITSTASLAGPGGLAQHLAKNYGAACVGIFAGVSAHSPREAVIAGAAEARRLGADLLVAVGGGSVIDATKVMQLALWGGVESAEGLGAYRVGPGPDRADVSKLIPGVRMVAIPTTLSAAEFTAFAGVTDVSRRAKEGYGHPLLAPRAVVLDPAMTLSTPPQLWFSTGMKAVDHAVEQLCNPVRSPYADALAEAGLKRLAQGLLATKERPGDLDARLECQIGMWLAMAGASAGRGLGASHAIGHTLGGSFGVPHGLTSCVALPAVLRWNEGVANDRQKLVAALLGNPELSASDAVRTLAHALDLPTDLAAIGIGPGQFRAIAEHTLHDRGIRSNPRSIKGAEDIIEILELARGTRGGQS